MIFISPIESSPDIAVWQALASPFRRRILDLLREGPRTTGVIGQAFPRHSRFAVMQHLRVLERARLVLTRRSGRERWNHLNAAPVHEIYRRWVHDLGDRGARMARAIKILSERKKPMATKTITERIPSDLKTLELELEYPIAATPQKVWQAMMRQSSRWWKEAGFYSRPNATRFHIEPAVGGRMWEELRGGGGVLWWNITALEPAKSLTLVGPMGSASKLAVEQVVIKLAPTKEGCVLRLEDRFLGRISDEKKHTQVFSDGWNLLFASLKNICEEKKTKGLRAKVKSKKSRRK